MAMELIKKKIVFGICRGQLEEHSDMPSLHTFVSISLSAAESAEKGLSPEHYLMMERENT